MIGAFSPTNHSDVWFELFHRKQLHLLLLELSRALSLCSLTELFFVAITTLYKVTSRRFCVRLNFEIYSYASSCGTVEFKRSFFFWINLSFPIRLRTLESYWSSARRIG